MSDLTNMIDKYISEIVLVSGGNSGTYVTATQLVDVMNLIKKLSKSIDLIAEEFESLEIHN